MVGATQPVWQYFLESMCSLCFMFIHFHDDCVLWVCILSLWVCGGIYVFIDFLKDGTVLSRYNLVNVIQNTSDKYS